MWRNLRGMPLPHLGLRVACLGLCMSCHSPCLASSGLRSRGLKAYDEEMQQQSTTMGSAKRDE